MNPRPRTRRRRPTTCVSPFDCRGRLRTEPSAPSASPEKFHHHASRRTVVTSLLNDGYSKATGLLRVTAHWFLSSESVVCVRSYVVFPQDLRGRGPRHAFRDPAPPSKPSRPRGVSRCPAITVVAWKVEAATAVPVYRNLSHFDAINRRGYTPGSAVSGCYCRALLAD